MSWDFDEEFGPAEFAAYEWAYWHEVTPQPTLRRQKILVPLDRSLYGTQRVLEVAQGLLGPEGEGILLHVIPPSNGTMGHTGFISARQKEKHERVRAINYLNYFAERLNSRPGQWRGEVVVSRSVAEGIADTAARENVDLITMYTHGRKGLARWIKGSVAERVRECAQTEVRIVKAPELAVA